MTFNLTDFSVNFLYYFLTNIKIGLLSLAGGLLLGVPFAFALRYQFRLNALIKIILTLCRAFPVYILMFIVFNNINNDEFLNEFKDHTIRLIAVVVALSAYTTAAICDATSDCLNHVSNKNIAQAYLIVPNIFRIFTIAMISSSIGAAIDVSEAVSYTVRVYESFPDRADRFLLVLGVTIFFAIVQHSLKVLVLSLSQLIQRSTQKSG